MQRQRLNVEEIDDNKDREQDQLAPLRRVAEEELDVLEHELALRDRQPAEQRPHRPTPQAAPNESLRPLLRLGEPLRVECAVQHGAERDECGGGCPEQDQRERIQLVSQESHDCLRRPFARQEGRRRAAQQNDEVQQVAETFRAGQLLGSDDAERQEYESEHLSGNQRSELLDRTQALQDLEQHTEDARPEQPSDDREDDELAGAAAGALLTQALQRGPPFGLQDVGERRLLDHATLPPRTSASSRTCAPPVSFRKSSS